MADVRAPFPTLEDASQVGQVLRVGVDGTTPASGINGQIGFAFKNNAGNLVLPQLTAAGKIAVDTTAAAGVNMRNRAESTAGSLTDVTLSSLTLTVDKVYQDVGLLVSCSTASIFQIVFSDNAVEEILADVVLDSGQYTFGIELPREQFTAGSTGPQLLFIRGHNVHKASALRSTLTAVELP